jgi:hypothetical protein
MPKKSKVSTSLKSWDNCPHTKKGETQILHDHSDNTNYEICRICGLSRRVYPVHPNNLKKKVR